MPELPEVQTVTTALRLTLPDAVIAGCEVRNCELRNPVDPTRLDRHVRGRSIRNIRRRGKFIIVELDPPNALVLHLGMSGRFRVCHQNDPPQKHDHVLFNLADGRSWRFNDPRRFGSVDICELRKPGADPESLSHLGQEPLPLSKPAACRGFDETATGNALATYLLDELRKRSGPVKNALLDQSLLAGLGNIYVNEALFGAGVHPKRACNRISRTRSNRLLAAIQQVLNDAIACGGTTIRDFKSMDGSEGQFSLCLNVYGKESEVCPRCGPKATIRRIVQAGRSTYYCPHCQH